jgi:hypothetical protein
VSLGELFPTCERDDFTNQGPESKEGDESDEANDGGMEGHESLALASDPIDGERCGD